MPRCDSWELGTGLGHVEKALLSVREAGFKKTHTFQRKKGKIDLQSKLNAASPAVPWVTT